MATAIPCMALVALLTGGVDPLSAQATGAPARPASSQGQGAVAGAKAGEAYYQFLLGRHLEAGGDVEGAIKAYLEAARLDPASGEVLAELAGLYARQDRPQEAIGSAEAALKLDPACVEAHRVLGLVFAAFAQDDQARPADGEPPEAYARRAIANLEVIEESPAFASDLGLQITLGRLYLKTNAFDRAIVVLTGFLAQQPDTPEVILLLVEAYQGAGRPQQAVTVLEDAARDEPRFYAMLADLYEREKRWAEAAAAYDRALAQSPKNTALKSRLAFVLLNERGDPQASRARDLLRDVLKDNPGDTRTLYMLVQAERALNDLDAAEATARRLIALSPVRLSGPHALAQVFMQRRDYRKVIETLEPAVAAATTKAGEQAQRTDPFDVTLLLNQLGFAHQELGEFDQAIAAFEQATRRRPDATDLEVSLVQAWLAAGRFDKTIELAAKARSARPDEPRFARLEADALRQQGRLDQGVALLEAALRAHPEDPTMHVALAELWASGERYEQSVRVLRDAQATFPADIAITFQLGATLERQKDYAEAERAFRQVLAQDPLNAPALNYLGYMLADRGERLEESVDCIRRALQVDPHNGAYLDSLGWAYFKLNKLDLAEENLRKAAEQRLRDSVVQDHYGDVLNRLGRYRQAVEAWKRALAGDGESVERAAIEQKISRATEKVR